MAKQQQAVRKFDKEVVAACRHYKKAIDAADAASNSREQKLWLRAAAAFEVSEVCAAKQVQYQRAAAKICNVPKQIITMDVKAEKLRRDLELEPTELPTNSVSAMYQLHCGIEVATKAAEGDPVQMAALPEKCLQIALAIKDGKISVREIVAQFAEERKKLAELRRGQRPMPPAAKDTLHPPRLERLDADAMRDKLEVVSVPTSIAMPVLTITPPDPSAQGIEAYLADAKMRTAIAAHCPAKGVMWILIDLNASEKATKTTAVLASSESTVSTETAEATNPQDVATPALDDKVNEVVPLPAVKIRKGGKRKDKRAA